MVLLIFLAATVYVFHEQRRPKAEHGEIVLWSIISVYDGDTIRIGHERIRIIGLDTPEIGKNARCNQEARMADEARNMLIRKLSQSEIRIVRDGKDRYERTLAHVFVDGDNVIDELIEAGLARSYLGGDRAGWCQTDLR